ncbi:MAG: HlyC/CorC family transporter [Alphaproteobacteria bacterium]|jgi:CBS domain containing-hemolysin-like protein|nr:HlyC/CorC family transporter [Alphaproteobacteria bacterium]
MNSALLSLLLAFFLLAANAFFVAAEFALVKAKGFRIESAAEAGSKAAQRTVRIQKNLEPYLAACQLGITMASLGLGWVGEPTVAALLTPVLEPLALSEATLHTVAFLVGFLVFSSLHIVVGEQVPKTLAIRKPEAMSMAIALPLQLTYVLFFPLTWLLNKASASILKLMGVEEATHGDVLTDVEIRGLVDVSAIHGHMNSDTAEMIHNVFKFDERSVARVMIPRIETDVLHLDASAESNLATMREQVHSRYPVVEGEGDDLVGMVLMVDLMRSLLNGDEAPWSRLETYVREPLVVPESLKVSRLFEDMREKRAHMACVVDEYGSFVGLVTLEDLLEEIVGEIADETDTAEQVFPIERKDDHWIAHGLASLADIERDTGFAVEDSFEANTISGFLMSRLQRIPGAGDSLEADGFRFTVEDVKGRRVQQVRIDPCPTEQKVTPADES